MRLHFYLGELGEVDSNQDRRKTKHGYERLVHWTGDASDDDMWEPEAVISGLTAVGSCMYKHGKLALEFQLQFTC